MICFLGKLYYGLAPFVLLRFSPLAIAKFLQ